MSDDGRRYSLTPEPRREALTRAEAVAMLQGECQVKRNESARAGRHLDAAMWEALRSDLALVKGWPA